MITKIDISCQGPQAKAAIFGGPLTAGAVGIPVMFAFDSAWAELTPTAIATNGSVAVPMVLDAEGTASLPWEVLTPNGHIRIGVDGWSGDGTVRVPTIWADVGYVCSSVVNADITARRPDPTPDQVQQIMHLAHQAAHTADSVRADADNGIFNGEEGPQGVPGYTPQKGVDYFDGIDGKDGYTPVKGIDYFDGAPGANGKDGYTPVKGIDYFDGAPGADGRDGYTPQKGVDYFTDDDIDEVAAQAAEKVTLADYVKKTDYATTSAPGVIIAGNGFSLTSGGAAKAVVRTAAEYKGTIGNYFIAKGTLDNVLAAPSIQPALSATELAAAKARYGIPGKTSELTNDSGFITDNNQFWAVYGATTAEEIQQAFDDGKAIFVDHAGRQYQLTVGDKTYWYFTSLGLTTNYVIRVAKATDDWLSSSATLQTTGNVKTSTSTAASTDTNYYSALAVDELLSTPSIQPELTEVEQKAGRNRLNAMSMDTDEELTFATVKTVRVRQTGNYITANAAIGSIVTYEPTANASYGWIAMDVSPNEAYKIYAFGGSAPRAWCFVNSEDVILSNSESNLNARDGVVVVAPDGAAKLIVQNNFAYFALPRVEYKDTTVDTLGDIRDQAYTQLYFAIPQSAITVTYDDTKGVAPYSTSYGYTNMEIDKDWAEENNFHWVEGGMYTFVLDSTIGVSANRNGRIRIGGEEDGDVWHPIFTSSGAITSVHSYMTKANNIMWVYKSTYFADGALQMHTDNNTTYAYLVNTILGDATDSPIHIDAKGYGARYGLAFPTTPLSDENGIVTEEKWSTLVLSSSTGNTKKAATPASGKFYIDRHPVYIYTANIAQGAVAVNPVYQDYTGYDARYTANLSGAYMTRTRKAFLWLKNFDAEDMSFESDAAMGNIMTLDKISTRFPATTAGDVYLYYLGTTGSNWYSITPAFTQATKIFKYTPSTGKLEACQMVAG